LLLCSSYLPLGVSNWTVIYIINIVPHQGAMLKIRHFDLKIMLNKIE
jgi:hypothetical protein